MATAKLFRRIFATIIGDVYVKAGNRESFSGNEDKDVKQRNFFTINIQYTVGLTRQVRCLLSGRVGIFSENGHFSGADLMKQVDIF